MIAQGLGDTRSRKWCVPERSQGGTPPKQEPGIRPSSVDSLVTVSSKEVVSQTRGSCLFRSQGCENRDPDVSVVSAGRHSCVL